MQRIIRLQVTLERNSRTETGVEGLLGRRSNALQRYDTATQRDLLIAADFDLGRYDSEGDLFVAETLNCVLADILEIKGV